MKLNNPNRIRTVKRVLSSNDLTIDVKKIYLVAFVESGSIQELQNFLQGNDKKFAQAKEKADNLPDDVKQSLMNFVGKDWEDIELEKIKKLLNTVHSQIN